MPSTVEELKQDIEDTMSEANSILLLNQNILEEYENRQRKVNLAMSDPWFKELNIKVVTEVEVIYHFAH